MIVGPRKWPSPVPLPRAVEDELAALGEPAVDELADALAVPQPR